MIFFNFLHDLFFRLSSKWWICRHQNVKNDSKGPNIASLVVVSLENLRSDIVRCTDDRILLFGSEVFVHIIGPLESQSKIDEFQVEGFVVEKSKVLRFEVSVADIVKMTVVDGLKDLDKYLSRFILTKLSLLIQMFIQLSSFKETKSRENLLSHEIKKTVILISFVQLHYVRVVQFFQDINFNDELVEIANVRF